MKKPIGFYAAYFAGRKARESGIKRIENPYHLNNIIGGEFGRRWFELWDRGWTEGLNDVPPEIQERIKNEKE